MKLFYLVLILFGLLPAFSQQAEYLKVQVKTGEGAYALLNRFGLERSASNINRFKKINHINDLNLKRNKDYKIPVLVYKFDGKSIRTTIGNNDWDHALSIQKYNESVCEKGIKENDYRKDKILWVPDFVPSTVIAITTKSSELKGIFPIFGKDNEEVKLKSSKLSGHVYYVVAGHGGPDPGAVVTYNGHTLCEDEYAYDISLRLAHNLLEHDATVYIITRDNNDGIRSDAYLKQDKDEVCYPNQVIPINQVKRLNQRVNAINSLYKEHKKKGAKKQRTIIIHVDSRAKGQRIDMFFYHNPKSNKGKKLANSLRETIGNKYATHQKNRGYSGTVKARNLHMLRETYPVAVYAELGNIRNSKDQKRFIIEDNRQAVANWLCEGIINDK
ncbi:MAG: N-acetylmuramoyl-L-alanine amidase [Bacteroidales bacterium]|nr:N-acetylmuramoyl-L-alanine amidase [Bacteroidales bacterium]